MEWKYPDMALTLETHVFFYIQGNISRSVALKFLAARDVDDVNLSNIWLHVCFSCKIWTARVAIKIDC